jgi:hypothetical protein
MMSFTATGQVEPDLLDRRDQLFDTSSDELRERRGQLEVPAPSAAADAWQHGEPVRIGVLRGGEEAGAPGQPAPR